jgi:exodeoxyribonuclease VII large subunit
MARQFERRGTRLAALGRALDTVSPLATLRRGYAIVTRADDGRVVTAASQVAPGDRLRTRLADGEVLSRVENEAPSS